MTYTSKMIEHSGLKYRIEMQKIADVWLQRHIWYPAPRTYVTEETAEEWIKGSQLGPDPRWERL